MRAIYRFLISLNTLFVVLGVCILLAFVGSVTLPAYLAFFSGIDDTPLFQWLEKAENIKATWWIFALIAVLALITISMLFCIADDLLKGLSKRNLVQKLSPQLIHAGTLLVLLGYLLTSAYGLRTDVLVKEGAEEPLSPSTASLYLEDLNVKTDEQGYFTDWEASIRYIGSSYISEVIVLKPARPLYHGGYGIYIKSISMGDEPAALIRVCRDPGAGWALLGGALLLTGALGTVYSRLRD
jgi:cytochrome c biogenesis factor